MSPFGGFVKWVIMPICFGVLGYYFVGPQIGHQMDQRPANSPSEASESDLIEPPRRHANREPEVEVYSQRAPRSSRRRTSDPPSPPPEAQDPPQIEEEPPMPDDEPADPPAMTDPPGSERSWAGSNGEEASGVGGGGRAASIGGNL